MRNRIALLSTAACLAIATGAQAQSVNYGQLEQFFGEPVTTSATGSPQKATDAPANMEIINADQIRRSGATNIPDILRFVSGLDVRHYSNGQSDVSVRGYNQPASPRLLVLVNGRQVYSDDFGYTSWDSIPVQLDEIRQIEVIKGPNSALFGFNAVGGVINIITYDPLNDSVNSVTARGGSDAYVGGSVVGTFHWGDQAGLRLSAGGYHDKDADPSNQPALGAPYDNAPYARSFAADGRLQITPDVLATLEGTSSQSQHASMLPSSTPLDDVIYRNISVKAGVAADTGLGLINVLAYRNDQHFTGAGESGYFTVNNVSYVAEANDLFKVGNDHTFRFGVEYRNNTVRSPVLLQGATGYQVYAGSAMWNWQVTPSIALTNSLRFDHLTLSRTDPVVAVSPFPLSQYDGASLTEPSFNSGLVYKVTDDDTVRLLASRGIQAPSLLDFASQVPIHSGPYLIGDVAGNPDTHAATVTNFEADYDRALPALHSVLRTAAYYQRTQDVINFAFSAAPIYLRLTPLPLIAEETQNIGSSKAGGGEIGIKGENAGWRWHASYSLIKIYDSLDQAYSPATPYPIGLFNRGTPTNAIIAGFGYTTGKWEMDVDSRWQSSFTDFATNNLGVIYAKTINNYLTGNLRIGYNVIDAVQLAVTAEQLNRGTIEETTGLPSDRRVLFSVSGKF
jgi:iron complex outermembrane receptor protein